MAIYDHPAGEMPEPKRKPYMMGDEFKPTTLEGEFTMKKKKDVTDEILDILSARRATPDTTIVEDIIEEEEIIPPLPELETTEWTERPDGKSERQIPFSKKYWKPKNVPDHLVWEFKGYDSPEDIGLYIPPKEEFEHLSLSFALNLKVNIVGPTGCGKTLMYEYYASSTGRPYLRIEHNVELDKASVFGQVHINVDDEGRQSTDFIPGVFVRSASEPTIVNLDELTRATGHSNMIYQRPLDRGEIFMPEMKDAGAAAIKPDPQWLLCASDNTKGNGEDLEKYPMSNVQDSAFINRWDIIIEQDYLVAKDEEKLIEALCPSLGSAQTKRLVKFSALVHEGFRKGEIQTAFSPRNLSCIAKFVNAGVELKTAINMNYTNRCGKSEQSDVVECIKSAFGSR